MMEPQTSRSLYEDVELAMAGYGSAICVARASLDTTDSDETNHAAAVGTMFSVKAKEDIEILGFEFLDLQFDAPLDVQIFMLKPKYLGEYEAASLEKDAWENVVSSSTAKETPEGVGAIVPRADMKKTIPLLANQVASFYFTLKSPHLQLSKSENLKTGQMYSEDGGLRVDVGIGLKDVFDLSQTDFFDYLKVANRAFQGKIHYHAIKDCSNFMTSTQIDLLFAYNATASSLDVSQAISDAFRNVLEEEPRLKRMMDQHKLEFESIDRNTSQVPFQGECSNIGFAEGCQVTTSVLRLQHYKTLTSKQVTIEMILEAMQHGGTFISNDQFTVQYVGDPVIQADYTIALGGMPKDTILNPTQRGYIGQVTSDFLEAYSSSEVYSLEIISQSFDQSQKRNLRRLQDGLVFVEASIFGVGVGNEAEEDFYASLDETFQSNSDQLLKHMSQQQYRPGRINSGSEDFGQVFASLISATAERYTAPSTEPQTTNSTASGSKKKVGFTETAQTTTWSLVLLFSTTFLAYNIMKDFFCEKRKVSPIMKDAIRDHENSKIGEFEEPSETSIGSKDSKQTGMTGFSRKVSIVKDKNNDSTSKSTARTNSSANDQNMAGKEDERVESEGRFKETKKMTNKDKMAKAQRKSNSDIDHRPNKGKKAKGRSKSTNDVDIRTNGEVGAQKKKKKRRSTKDKDGLKKMSKRTSSRSNHTGVID